HRRHGMYCKQHKERRRYDEKSIHHDRLFHLRILLPYPAEVLCEPVQHGVAGGPACRQRRHYEQRIPQVKALGTRRRMYYVVKGPASCEAMLDASYVWPEDR